MSFFSLRIPAVLALCVIVSSASAAKICIDPGHGGTDPGAVGCGQQEATNVLNTALKFRDYLNRDTSDGAGGGSWAIVMTRSTNVFVSLSGRCSIANNNGCDRFMSIHNNACGSCGGTGTGTYSYANTGTQADLRNKVQFQMVAAWGLKNRGNMTGNFAVLRDTNMGAELAELAFIDNCGIDANYVGNAGRQDSAALAHLYAVQNHFGIASYRPGTGFVVGGAIKVKYDSLGGAAGILGPPITNELTCPDGVGKYNHFQNSGSIYWTPSTGAWSIRGEIRAKWSRLGWEGGVCGYPVTDEGTCPDGVGKYNHFNKGTSIYWTPTIGAFEVHGGIRTKWSQLGWETGICGYPMTDESVCGADGQGRFNHFSKGCSIYYHPASGIHQVGGAIRSKWAELGWEGGSLGYPTSDEYGVPEGRRSDFQGGALVWNASTGVVSLVVNTPPPADVIVDNATAGFTITGTWSTGTSAADKYGADYRYHSTGTSGDVATWSFTAAQARGYDIYAWWCQGTNRSAAAPYVLPDGAGVAANQQANGGKWNLIGTKNLAAGANTVKLGCNAATGFIAIADAVKIVAK